MPSYKSSQVTWAINQTYVDAELSKLVQTWQISKTKWVCPNLRYLSIYRAAWQNLSETESGQ